MNQRTKFGLNDILRLYLPNYLKQHRISLRQRNILYDIQVCRTSACGAHIEECDTCNFRQPQYNSCHNRHCPKCQGISQRRWVSNRLNELLPVPYYHVVFTLPHSLNKIALYNKKLIYALFYHAASYTLLRFGKDPKYLGAQLGFIGVLHTWGKGLCQHIHWHFIVAGCGLRQDGSCVHLPYSDTYLFPVRAMSSVIKARFIKLLRRSYEQEKIAIPESQEALHNPRMFEYFLNDLASEEWVNYCKRPFGSPEQVIKYIGRYTHRVAVSNNRILDIHDGRIKLQVKNYKEGKNEEIKLTAEEFIRRFLLHILPKRFRKIRYGGFLARSVKDEKLQILRQSLAAENYTLSEKYQTGLSKIEDNELCNRCPQCNTGEMHTVEVIHQSSNAREFWLKEMHNAP